MPYTSSPTRRREQAAPVLTMTPLKSNPACRSMKPQEILVRKRQSHQCLCDAGLHRETGWYLEGIRNHHFHIADGHFIINWVERCRVDSDKHLCDHLTLMRDIQWSGERLDIFDTRDALLKLRSVAPSELTAGIGTVHISRQLAKSPIAPFFVTHTARIISASLGAPDIAIFRGHCPGTHALCQPADEKHSV
jgi:hypothetical protein